LVSAYFRFRNDSSIASSTFNIGHVLSMVAALTGGFASYFSN
jgi:hypothetical protein